MAFKGIKTFLGTSLALLATGGLVYGGYTLFSNKLVYNNFYKNPISNNDDGYITAYNGARLNGASVLVCPGFDHTMKITKALKDYPSKFKDTGFILLDDKVSVDSRSAANTSNVTFRSDLGSIKTGVAVAYFLNYYQSTFADDGKLTWATWGGRPYPSVTSFMGGIQHGIKWANENLAGKQVNGKTYMQVEQVFGNSDFTNGFGPAGEPHKGIITMQSIINKRPDILFPVAGPQVWTAQTEIEKLGNSKTILVGVDSIVEEDANNKKINFKTPDGQVIGNGKRVQFSSLKNLARATDIVLSIINNGNKIPEQDPNDPDRYKNFSATGATGEPGGIGTSSVGDIVNGCVGISPKGQNYFDEAIKLSGSKDPSLDPKYSLPENMKYVGVDGEFNYQLDQNFSLTNNSGVENLDLKGFVKKGNNDDKNKIMIILSTVESILMDSSFAQSCYVGLYNFYSSMNIKIPEPPKGSK